jgi:hypothetical protein
MATIDLASHVLPDLKNPTVTPVRSHSKPGVIHLVIASDDGPNNTRAWTCTCPATITNCWHVREVRANHKEN